MKVQLNEFEEFELDLEMSDDRGILKGMEPDSNILESYINHAFPIFLKIQKAYHEKNDLLLRKNAYLLEQLAKNGGMIEISFLCKELMIKLWRYDFDNAREKIILIEKHFIKLKNLLDAE